MISRTSWNRSIPNDGYQPVHALREAGADAVLTDLADLPSLLDALRRSTTPQWPDTAAMSAP